MKQLIKIFFAMILVSGVNSAFADTQDRHLSGFHAVMVTGPFDVYITQGSTESVRVEAPGNIIDHIITEVKGDALIVRDKTLHFNWGDMFGNKKIAVYVTIKDVHNLSISGSGDVYFKEGLSAPNLQIDVTGSGDVQGKLNVKTLITKQSGSGDVKLSGTAETSTVSLTGSGDFSGHGLVTATTMVRTSGSGDAAVNATQRVDAHVSGSGDIRYTGGAKQVSSSTSGSGEVHRG